MRVLNRLEKLAKLSLQALDGHARPLGEIVGIELTVAGRPDRVDRDLRPVLGVNAEAPCDVDGRTGRRRLEAVRDLVPGDRFDRARAIADDQAEPVAAASPLPK